MIVCFCYQLGRVWVPLMVVCVSLDLQAIFKNALQHHRPAGHDHNQHNQGSVHSAMHLSAPAGALRFLKTSADPKQFTTVPPNMFNQSTFPKNVSLNGNWVVRADGDVAGPVKDKSGLVLWNTQNGVADIARYGFLAGSATTYNGPSLWWTIGVAPATNFEFTQDVALPYEHGSEQNVSVSPDLSEDFSVVRTYAGQISLISDSVPIGNTALTGRFAGGAINDVRDIQQTPSGPFAESALQQQTITSKDGIKNIGVAEGIVTVLGPDLKPTFGPAETHSTIGQGISDVVSVSQAVTYRSIDVGQNDRAIYANPLFLTPIEGCSWGGQFFGVNVDTIKIPNLPSDISPRVTVRFPSTRAEGLGSTSGIRVQRSYNVCHFYARVDANGNVIIANSENETTGTLAPIDSIHVGVQYALPGPGTNWDLPNESMSFGMPNGIGARKGTYIGTLIIPTIENTSGAANAARLTPAVAANDHPWLVDLEAVDLYNSGKLGPTRVLRWDNVSPGQELKLDGVLLAQCVPEGQIAPFVSPTAQMQQVALHLNVFPWLNAVYNGPGPIKRVYKGSDYAKMVSMFRDEALEDQMKLSDEDAQAGEAAGLFSTLGALAGSALGSMIGTGAGQFGSDGEAGGQFGSAGGQFGAGEAMGLYDQNPKRLRY